MDLSTLPLTPEQLAATQQGLAEALSHPWFYPLLGALERVFALTLHVALAVVVLQAVRRRNLLWLLAAILWHAFANALALMVLSAAGPYWSEAALAVIALISLAIILALRDPAPVETEPPAPSHPGRPASELLTGSQPLAADQLDKTRYQ
jgi:uncharacterized membrane protein YhfC